MCSLDKYTYLNNSNHEYVEALYETFRKTPLALEEKWRAFFEGYEFYKNNVVLPAGPAAVPSSAKAARFQIEEIKVSKLIQAYRARGHLMTQLDPLADKNSSEKRKLSEFQLSYFGLSEAHLDQEFEAAKEIGLPRTSLRTLIAALEKIYCSTIGYEFVYCSNSKLRLWSYDKIESVLGEPTYSDEKLLRIHEHLLKATVFENFLQTKYVGQKRFGIEGGEALIPALNYLIDHGVERGGIDEFVLGMAHRGRLNVLVNVLDKKPHDLFVEFEGGALPTGVKGDWDVKYHLGHSVDLEKFGRKIHLSLAFNPSHLEAVDPIVSGINYGKCTKYFQGDKKKIVPILIHGDASVSGQGVVYELANLSDLPGYDNGGTIHIVVNNQIGFTAGSKEMRSSIYCTDIAKVTEAPIFHVNGDDPVRLVWAFETAVEIRQQFSIDVWIEIVCYRRRGHNEGDEPRFTQPLLYKKIAAHPNTLTLFEAELIAAGKLSKAVALQKQKKIVQQLEADYRAAKENSASVIQVNSLKRYWQEIEPAAEADFSASLPTPVSKKTLDRLSQQLFTVPKDFNLFSKMKKIYENRQTLYRQAGLVDWALAELLSYASLLHEGHSVRLTGQDVTRGTFTHRHAVIKDEKTNLKFFPLEACATGRAYFRVVNTPLSEYSVLGFEYGFSLARPFALTVWESQFGDFANGAQIIIDQFISSGETKWQRYSGLVMLLPHGYEGMGPEHSSARLERFLQLCADNNMYVVNITTPANFFHALRRQIRAPFRKPLVVMSPKSLLRHPKVVSKIDELCDERASFKEILDDPFVTAPKSIKRVVLCSGKLYYDLLAYREKYRKRGVALVRLEQLYPLLPLRRQFNALRSKYSATKEWVWAQEEPINMGAWFHIRTYLQNIFPKLLLQPPIGRNFSSSPASGLSSVHRFNQEKIIAQAFAFKKKSSVEVATKKVSLPVSPPKRTAKKVV